MRARDTWVLVATIVGSSLAFIDGAVVTLALPQLQRTFSASASDVAWVVELYALVIGALTLLGGALADHYGRKRIFAIGAMLFALGSIGCAFAWSIPSLLFMRVFQAVGGMLVAPASLAIIGAHFAGDARGRAIALWSAFGSLTGAMGPLLGGVLIDALGWRSVFWINIPLVLVVLYATIRHIDESRDPNAAPRLDWFGAALTVVGLGALTLVMLSLPTWGWRDPRTAGCFALSIVALAWFVLHELRASNAMIPRPLWRLRTFGAINLATFLLYGALGAMLYELPFSMIQVHGYDALHAAFGSLPFAVCIVVLSRFGAGAASRFGLRATLTFGPLLVAVGFALLALLAGNDSYATSYLPGIVIAGIGMGFTVAPLTNGVIAAAGANHVGIASGISNTVARVASLLAIAAFTAIVAIAYTWHFDYSVNASKHYEISAAQRAEIAEQTPKLGGARFKEAWLQTFSDDAFRFGFSVVAFGCALLALGGAVVDAFGIDEREATG